MTVNSLINMGVPSVSGQRSPPLQPILGNHWRITFYDFGDPGNTAPYVVTQQAKGITLPSLTFGNASLYAYVSVIYIATRAEWDAVDITFSDDITSGIMSLVQEQSAKQQNMFDQTTSRAGENYKFEMDLDILAGGTTAGPTQGDPNILRRYSYAGCFLTKFSGSPMQYQNADPIEFTINVRYDNVVAFDNYGIQLGTFSDAAQIASRAGTSSTGIGAAANSGVNVGGNSVSLGAGGGNLAQ